MAMVLLFLVGVGSLFLYVFPSFGVQVGIKGFALFAD